MTPVHNGLAFLSMNPPILAWLFLGLLAYGGLVWLAHHVSLWLLFPRPPASYVHTSDYFFLEATDGARIAARWWSVDDPRRTVLWFHGNGEDLGTIADAVGEWQRRGFAVLAIDYRGYGLSGGRPTEANTYADAETALAWLRDKQGIPCARIVALGYSLGGGPAVELGTRYRLAGLFLLAPFVSAYRVKTVVPLVAGDKFVNLEKMGRLRCPLLVIHGTADRTVPLWHGQRLHASAKVRKQALWVRGAGHGDVAELAGDNYWETIEEFVGGTDEEPSPPTGA